MHKTSRIAPQAVLKLFLKHARHPWIARRLAALQAEKWLFGALGPGPADGSAKTIRQLSIRITDVCNLRCVMCGQWGERGFLLDKDLAALKREEIPPRRYAYLLDDLIAHGHWPVVYLWGGEPMLYPGTLEIISHAARLGLPTAIATNGTRLPQGAEVFARAPMYLLQVSIDGHDSALHNAIRRSPSGADTFAEIMHGLGAVREARDRAGRGLPIIASLTTISRENHGHLVDIYERLAPEVDFLVFYLSWWIDEPAASAHDVDFERRFGFRPELHRGWIGGWKPEDHGLIQAQLKEIRERSARKGTPPAILIPDIDGVENLRTYYTDHSATFGYERCVSIRQAVEINSNGDMSPCRDYHDYVVGNVRDHTVSELWNSEPYRRFRQSLARDGLMPACARCCGLMGY
ncbi:MAG: radical SAM protein [Desulfovibrio aminophilus]|uniref:radical SAM protein n=1 Tax=Desulfovibrio aminophilus TaxID=81425 RepID=UPI0039ECA8B2